MLNKTKKERLDNQTYDIFTLQNQRKYENQKKIKEIRIRGEVVEGTVKVVEKIQEEMEEEMKSYGTLGMDKPPTPDELKFLDIIPQVEWLPKEIEKLNEPTTEQEVYDILRFETDLDSAPGEDGLTSRALWTFWNFPAFRWLFIGFLNYTRFNERFVQTGNIGIMVVKNKKISIYR